MERYDYTDMGNTDLVLADMEILSRSQLRAVGEAITEIKKRSELESLSQFSQWFDTALLPMFKNFAETTCSVLEVSRNPADITAVFRNPQGVDFSDDCRGMKTAFCMAGNVYVQKEGDGIILGMLFCKEHFRG